MAKGTRKKSKFREYTEVIVISAVLALLVRSYIVQAFRIPSGSMEDTLLVGDFLLVSKFIYRFTDPKPGDVIVFRYPMDPKRDFIKRCVAAEGQTVQIKDKVLYVDGKRLPAPERSKFVDPNVYPASLNARDNYGPVKVPVGMLFVLGDNRDNSRDSRYWGYLDKRLIKGRAFVLYWSWKGLPGDPQLAKIDGPILLDLPKFLYSFVKVLVFDVVRIPWRVRWSRIGDIIR
ncbi:signal peptidase I [Candidatus Zixiibacteriota bacterium]